MSENLYELAEQVHDEESFLNFIFELAADREDEIEKEKVNPSSPYSPGANGWENGSIEAFLRAAGAWGMASKRGMRFYEPPVNIWTRAAHILYAGKIYE